MPKISKKDYLKITAVRLEGRAIPKPIAQVDPEDQLLAVRRESRRQASNSPQTGPATDTVAEVAVPIPAAPGPAPARPLQSTGTSAGRSRLVTLGIVDRSELPHNRGFSMYPSRHKQLLDMAFFEGRKPWQIIDDALTAYVKQHYGDEPDSDKAA